MRPVSCVFGMLLVIFITFQTLSRDDEPTIRSLVVTSRDLPVEFDSTRTYHYNYLCTNPESLLTALWDADVRVWQAWLPLDNMCMDPVGPRFTVELESEDASVSDLDFSPGDGRLHCATRLKRFVVSE